MGTVIRVDGDHDIAVITGLDDCAAGERVDFEGGAVGFAIALERGSVQVALLDRGNGLSPGDRARTSGPLTIAPRGRCIDVLGRPMDGKPPVENASELPIFARSPRVIDRAECRRSLLTGTKVMDLLAPVHHGQRVLLQGPPVCGKSDVLVTAAASAPAANVTCVFVAAGVERQEGALLLSRLVAAGADPYVVFAFSDAPAAARMLVPHAAMAIAERVRDEGRDALVCFDGFARSVGGYREVYPKAIQAEVFSHLARLLERAGQLSPERGGGSITLLAAIDEATGDRPADPLHPAFTADVFNSFERDLFLSGSRPALACPVFISKIASGCVPALRRHAGSFRLVVARGIELERMALAAASPLDAATRSAIASYRRARELLSQPPGSAVGVRMLAALSVAMSTRLVDRVPEGLVPAFERLLAEEIARTVPADAIVAERPLAPETVKKLEDAAHAVLTRLT